MENNIKVGIIGAGNLGLEIEKVLRSDENFLVKTFDIKEEHEKFDEENAADCNILVLTVPGKMIDNSLKNSLRNIKVPLIVASTSCDEETEKIFIKLKDKIPVVKSNNYSELINRLFIILNYLVQKIKFLNADIYDIHHIYKIDNSGTAKRMAEIISPYLVDQISKKRSLFKKSKVNNSVNLISEMPNETLHFIISGRNDLVLDAIHILTSMLDCLDTTSLEIDTKYYFIGDRLPTYNIGKVSLNGTRILAVPGSHYIELESPDINVSIEHIAKSKTVFADGIVEVIKNIDKLKPGLYTSENAFQLFDVL